ncbi:MAG: agmatinase family protein [Salinivirgaceae bacterium]|nr:agmatinase family protein [Salinivirgaceae bacterium]
MSSIDFDPNGIGLDNGNFMGLPFTPENAKIEIISVPWDVTVSYADGTSSAPENILNASMQLDLFQPEIKDAWKLGVYLNPSKPEWIALNIKLRNKAIKYIDFLANGNNIEDSAEFKEILNDINSYCEQLNEDVYKAAKKIISEGKIPAVLGGEHSVPLGLLKALSETELDFGVLHIDAHMDLRNAYEGFQYSHASIFNNAIKNGYVKNIVQVGIRDFCEQEVEFAKANNVHVFHDYELKANDFEGITWHKQCEQIISKLPQTVYISFDIDGLDPQLCPNTGTPVPGGLTYDQAQYLIKLLVKSNRKIIGFDLCEVGGKDHEWDGNVGARLLYFLCNWTGRSNGLI